MSQPLTEALAGLRPLLLDPDSLVRAVASGRQRGRETPWRRAELRYVDLKAGRHLQVTTYDDAQAHTANHAVGAAAAAAVDGLLETAFGNWHVDTVAESRQLRVTKKGEALVHATARSEPVEVDRGHDRDKQRLLPEDDPVLIALGISDSRGRAKPSRQAKYRQVEEFLRLLDSSLMEAMEQGLLRRPTADEPLRIVDLGCGNAYLTFAAHRFLVDVRGLPVRLTGVDVKQQSRDHNQQVAAGLGTDAEFVVGTISDATLDRAPEVVLALHACDTATDEALARAVAWQAPLVLAAPCCHHDIAAQLRAGTTPAPYRMLTRHGILRERFADTLTDALRASLLRLEGYRVDVVQFVGSEHTPRNTMLRATRTGSGAGESGVGEEYDELVTGWGVRPRLAELLGGMAPPRGLRDALLALVVAAPFGLALTAAADVDRPRPEFRFADPAIVESSGLAVVDGLVITVNDSGDEARVFAVDPATGETVGVTRWGAEAVDIEALAPGGDGTVWVGDIGDNAAARGTITVTRVPVGPGERTVDVPSYRLRYADGATDAEALLADPRTGRLSIVTKGVFGGIVHAAPFELREDRVNVLRRGARTMSIVTDGAFLPGGDHVVLRDYGRAVVYEVPSWEPVGDVVLPEQQQGEAIAAAGPGRVLVSSEGQSSPVFSVALPDLARATPTDRPGTRSREGEELPEQPPGEDDHTQWFLGVGLALVAGLVLIRSLRPR